MPRESFLIATGTPSPTTSTGRKPAPATSAKDATLLLHTLHPSPAPSQVFKKTSAAGQNSVGVSDAHVFAAQSGSAVVNVYGRATGGLELVLPLRERVGSLVVIGDGGWVVGMGMEGGRVMLWETCTGRVVSTSPAHLAPVTRMAASPDSSHLLTSSVDSTVHVWSIPALLSFTSAPAASKPPLHALTAHKAAITALAVSPIPGPHALAVSASEDGTARAWEYRTGRLARTFLLGAGDGATPRCVTIDGADRGFFVGCDDGSVVGVDWFAAALSAAANPLFAPDAAATPCQPGKDARWRPLDGVGAALCLALSFDGAVLISGHEGGRVLRWDVGARMCRGEVVAMAGPVTNLLMLPVEGLRGQGEREKGWSVDKVVRPRFDNAVACGGDKRLDGEGGEVPGDYAINARFVGHVGKRGTEFEDVLNCTTGFPPRFLEDSLAELQAWKLEHESGQTSFAAVPDAGDAPDFIPLDAAAAATVGSDAEGKTCTRGEVQPPTLSLEEQNRRLRLKIEALQRVQEVAFKQIDDLRTERERYLGSRVNRADRGGER